MGERRASIRVPLGLKTALQPIEEEVPSWLATCQDFSRGGMRVFVSRFLSPGQKLCAEIILPPHPLLSPPKADLKMLLQGTVVWAKESDMVQGRYEAGIRWDELPPSVQAQRDLFLARATQPIPAPEPFRVKLARLLALRLC